MLQNLLPDILLQGLCSMQGTYSQAPISDDIIHTTKPNPAAVIYNCTKYHAQNVKNAVAVLA